MEEEKGVSKPFPSSSSGFTANKPQIEEDSELRDFSRFFERIISTDSQKSKEAEYELELIAPLSKCSFLLKGYQKTKIDEHRQYALNALSTHLENNWNYIFPKSHNYEKLNDFCHELLGLVQNETNAIFRETLAFITGITARKRLEDTGGVQEWEKLMEYLELSPKSNNDVHMRVALAIVMQVPDVFGAQFVTCGSFFQSCIYNDFEFDQATLIKAYVAVYSSAKCTMETRAELDDLIFAISCTIVRYHEKKRKADAAARNELAELLIILCLESTNVNTQIMGLQVFNVKWQVQSLDRECLTLLKILIESCLTSSHLSARSIALSAFATNITERSNDQSPLCDLFPSILAMCEEDPLAEEERQMVDNGQKKFTPLNCIDEMTHRSSSLIRPHFQSIVNLCREILEISSPLQSELTERSVCFSIILNLLSNYWEQMHAVFGQAYMMDLFEFVTTIASDKALRRKFINMSHIFARRAETTDQNVRFLATVLPGLFETCEDANSTFEEKKSCMEMLRTVTVNSPILLKPILSPLISLCCQMSDHANDDYRELASDILHLLCQKSAGMIKANAADSIPTFVESTLRKAANCDDGYFLVTDPEEMDEEDDVYSDQLIDRALNPFGASCVLPILIDIARKYHKDGDVQKRHKAVLAWAAVSMRCASSFIDDATTILASYLDDTQPQVRGIACHSLQQVTKREAEHREKMQIDTIMPLLVPLIKETTFPRLISVAGSTIAAFISITPKQRIVNFAPILNEVVALIETEWMNWLASDKQFLLDPVLAPILALCTKDPLVIYSSYEQVMAPLRAILRERPREETLVTIVNCYSLIGSAAGKTKFHPDGLDMLRSISFEIPSLLTSETFAADFIKIIGVVGVDSVRFLPAIVPQLITACKEFDELRNSSDHLLRYNAPKKREAAKMILKFLAAEMSNAFSPYVKDVKALGI